jgi:hypothetical protein
LYSYDLSINIYPTVKVYRWISLWFYMTFCQNLNLRKNGKNLFRDRNGSASLSSSSVHHFYRHLDCSMLCSLKRQSRMSSLLYSTVLVPSYTVYDIPYPSYTILIYQQFSLFRFFISDIYSFFPSLFVSFLFSHPLSLFFACSALPY